MKDIEQLKNELKVIGYIQDALKYGQFQGTHAQNVAIGQMYLQGLCNQLDALVKAEANKSVESKAEPVVAEANKAS